MPKTVDKWIHQKPLTNPVTLPSGQVPRCSCPSRGNRKAMLERHPYKPGQRSCSNSVNLANSSVFHLQELVPKSTTRKPLSSHAGVLPGGECAQGDLGQLGVRSADHVDGLSSFVMSFATAG